ncbi:MAG: serine hydrolase domain-containing protein [Bacteroidales bacterium]|jgi:CubicO group peptidase (beta-lactamase class C family)|nr:serine hydrolase domain-containing protein [Bacteroidales bacterium]
MDETDKILTEQVSRNKTPSVQYFYFDQDSIIKSFQMGFADIAKKKEVDSFVTYSAYSLTKTFTALAVLQLFAKGTIDINKPVSHYLPDFKYGTEITVKQLLNHTAGIPNPVPLDWIHSESEHKIFDRDIFFNAIFEKNTKTKSEPNEKFAYSNLGYVVLGQLIEKVSGKKYEEYVIKNIIQKLPVNPEDLTFEVVKNENHATGYHKRTSFSYLLLGLFFDKSLFMGEVTGKWRPFKRFYVNGASYGGLIGTPGAFVTYLQELMKTENSLIPDEYRQLLFQENLNNKGENTGMCLSWFSGELDGNRYIAHAGGGGGYYCEIRIYPDIKQGSVIFFNRTGMSDERFLDKTDRFLINDLNSMGQ